MCTVLGVARSTYYKSFDKTKSSREIQNKELKAAIIRIYRKMTELGVSRITAKKYKPHSNKKVAEGLENVLKRDITTTSINGNLLIKISN